MALGSSQETTKWRYQMIPKMYERQFFAKSDYKEGMLVKVMNEFKDGTVNDDGTPAKYECFLRGDVQLEDGATRELTLNKTSYAKIATTLGNDTSKWIGKIIKFEGEQKCGKMMGRVWVGA